MTNQDYDEDTLDEMFEDRARLAYKIESSTFSAVMRDFYSQIVEWARTNYVATLQIFDLQRIEQDRIAEERRKADMLAKRTARLQFLKREAAKEYYYRRDHE